MKKLISLLVAVVMIVAMFSGLAVADDLLAEVTTGSETVSVSTVEDLVAAISPDGTSTVKLMKDFVRTMPAGATSAWFKIDKACTLDLNGYTWDFSGVSAGNAVTFRDTTGAHVVVKNGTIIGPAMGITIQAGSFEIQDCTIISTGSYAIGLYDLDPAKSDKNLINNCTIVANSSAVNFQAKSPNAGTYEASVTITNSKLVNFESTSMAALHASGDAGKYILGKGVEIYTVENAYSDKVTLEGESLKLETGLQSIEVKGTTYSNLAKYATPAAEVAPVDPAPVDPAPVDPAPVDPTPDVPSTDVPDEDVPKTGVSIAVLGLMATVSMAGAAFVARKKD